MTKKTLTDPQRAYAASLLTPILLKYHNHLDLMEMDTAEWQTLRKLLIPISPNTLALVMEVWRDVERSQVSKKSAATLMKKEPGYFSRIGKNGGKKGGWPKGRPRKLSTPS